MRGASVEQENVIVRLHADMIASGGSAPDLSGKSVTLTINGGEEQYTLTSDANGIVDFGSFDYGTQYTISVGSSVTGYSNPRSVMHNANMNTRYVDMTYRLQYTGWYVIANDSLNHIDIADWDTANNGNAVLLGYQNSNFRFAIKIKNRSVPNKKWQNAGVLLSDYDKYVASTNASTFMTAAYLADVEYEGTTYSRMSYNTMIIRKLATAASQVVPAVDFCYGDSAAGDGSDYSAQTVTIGGSTYHGCLPLLAMLDLFKYHARSKLSCSLAQKLPERKFIVVPPR